MNIKDNIFHMGWTTFSWVATNQLWKFLQFVAFGNALLVWLPEASAATRRCNAGGFWGGGSVHLDFIGLWPVHVRKGANADDLGGVYGWPWFAFFFLHF